MTHQYLLEIGMEEIPARMLVDLSEQFTQRMESFLVENRLTFNHIRSFSTPRRLSLIVDGLAEKQTDLEEKVKGPALRIAQDEDGNWTKAAQGFARGQGASVEDIVVEPVKDEDYIFINKFVVGQTAGEVLENAVSILEAMTFPVSMTWHDLHTPFIRPVHWMVSLLDEVVVPFEFVGVTASNESLGHRFLGNNVTITSAETYEEQLEAEFVLVDFEKRSQMIYDQISALASENNWQVPIDEELLEEVTALVEWPTAFYGYFEEKYLEVPKIILVTAMKDHQRYFYAENPTTGELLPVFISVRNGNNDHIANVIKGNKKVLKARLEDALFFYEDDLKHSIDDYVEKLNHVNEHYKLGTLADKQVRVQAAIPVVAEAIKTQNIDQAEVSEAVQAAKIYKFDLMTGIIDEFAELQGKMGEWYARHAGVDEGVAGAIGTQYLPLSSGGDLPDTRSGSLLAITDKLDTLVNYFNVGLIPTGSNDPYALRRQAMGIVEIIIDQAWDVDLELVVEQFVKQLDTVEQDALVDQVNNFILARLEPVFAGEKIDYDIMQAVFKASHLNINYMVASAKLLQELKENQPEQYRAMVESLTRVVNLGAKVEDTSDIEADLAASESEVELINHVDRIRTGNISPSEQILAFNQLVEPIQIYFENNMVNADDKAIKENRYATMKQLSVFIHVMMDPRELISKF